MSDDTRQARIDDERHDAATNAIRADNPRLTPLQARHIARIALDAADAVGRERVSEEMVNAAVEAFNAVTQQRTGKSLYGTWWPYEYLPAMKAALEAALLTAAPAEPSMTKLDKDAEAAIEAARNLLLHLHLETMTGATLTTPAVQELMTALDDAIFAWDESKPPQDDESRWHVWTPERGHDETGEKP